MESPWVDQVASMQPMNGGQVGRIADFPTPWSGELTARDSIDIKCSRYLPDFTANGSQQSTTSYAYLKV